jgi:hypothetical protein
MARKKKQPEPMQEPIQPLPGEDIIQGPNGGAIGIAIRSAETKDSFRMLITIRAGFNPEKIVFNLGPGSYGNVSAQGPGDGNEPPCP